MECRSPAIKTISPIQKKGQPMTRQFENMNDLSTYLDGLERRVNVLEAENNRLRSMPQANPGMDGNMISRYVAQAIPQTSLVSPNFLSRAFAVWGHYFVANLLISIIVGVIIGALYACLILVFGATIFSSIMNNVP
jgi:hypothetical protein